MIPLSGWSYCKQKNIPNTYINADLTDYSYPIFIDADMDIGGHALLTGYDIRFTAADGLTLLSYERRSFAIVGGAATGRWIVKIPERHAAGGDFIYIHYGKVGASDGADKVNAYDASFKRVWAMNEAYSTAAGNYKDSKSVGNLTLTDADGDSAQGTGPIDKAVDLNGDADYLTDADHVDHDPGGAMTIEVWIKLDAVTGSSNPIVRHDLSAQKWQLYQYISGANTLPAFRAATVSGGFVLPGTTLLNADLTKTYYIVGTYDKTLGSLRAKIFVQGIQESSTNAYNEDITDGDEGIVIGRGVSTYQNGLTAEVRYSNIARSAAWIKATYHDIISGYQPSEWGAEEQNIQTLAGSIDAASSLSGDAKMIARLAGSIQAASTLTGETKTTMKLAGAIAGTSAISGGMKIIMKLAGTMAGSSTLTGNITEIFRRLKAILFTAEPRKRIAIVPDRKRIQTVDKRT